MTRAACLAICALLAVLAPAASAATKTETGSSGDVSASLTYDYKKARYGPTDFSNAHVSITRAGVQLVDETLGKECAYCTPWPASMGSNSSSVDVRDLDGDGEPEVLINLFTGGANCCWFTESYRYDEAQNRYIKKHLMPGGSFPYVLKDLNGDGSPEFKSIDSRFAYKYGSNVHTPRPLRIFEWDGGKLVDATIAFPKLAARDAASMYRVYLHVRRIKHANVRGVLAAYLADSYNASNGRTAWRRVVAAYRRGELDRQFKDEAGPFGKKYLTSLRAFLKKLGYLRRP